MGWRQSPERAAEGKGALWGGERGRRAEEAEEAAWAGGDRWWESGNWQRRGVGKDEERLREERSTSGEAGPERSGGGKRPGIPTLAREERGGGGGMRRNGLGREREGGGGRRAVQELAEKGRGLVVEGRGLRRGQRRQEAELAALRGGAMEGSGRVVQSWRQIGAGLLKGHGRRERTEEAGSGQSAAEGKGGGAGGDGRRAVRSWRPRGRGL